MLNNSDKPARPYRQRTRRDGRLVPVKRADSAGNACPRKIFPVHAGAAKVLRKGVIDRRGVLGSAFYSELAGLRSHVGGEPSLPQERLTEQGARLHLLEAMAWAEVQGAGRLIRADGTAHPALDVLLRTMRERREVLKLLGLERRAKPVQTLDEIMAHPQIEPEPVVQQPQQEGRADESSQ